MSSLNVENTGVEYLGFGSAFTPHQLTKNDKWGKVAQVATFIFSAMAMGALAGLIGGGVAGAGIGALSGLALAGILVISQLVFKKIWQILPSMNSVLPPEILNSIPNEGPKLGEASQADLRLITHVTETFEWKKKLIETAEKSIEFSPNYGGGEKFRELLQAIDKRMSEKPELKIHIICSKELLESRDKKYLAHLSKNPNFHCVFSEMIYHIGEELWVEENHVKLLVVDEKYFVMGGSSVNDFQTREIAPNDYKCGNLAGLAMPSSFRDTDIAGKGWVASRMRGEFFKLFSIWEQRTQGATQSHYFPVIGIKGTNEEFEQKEGLYKNVKARFFVGGPEHRENNGITQAYLNLINGSKKSIRIAGMQFNPNKKIAKALKNKKNEVDIVGQFNNKVSRFMVVYPSRANYQYINQIFEYKNKNTMYHKKLMTVDDKFAIIGSYNFSNKSSHNDHEIAFQIEDEDFVKALNEDLNEDLLYSKEYIRKNKVLRKVEVVAGTLLGAIFYNLT